jgi:hypothetical protein
MIQQSRWMAIALAAIVLIGFGPMLSALFAIVIANAWGCVLNEASGNPCAVAGFEVGDLLAGMFVFGWMELVTLPFGVLALLIWVVAALVMSVRRKRASS